MTGQEAEKLGYLGLGMMGFPMARRLLNAVIPLACIPDCFS
jgi:3-hydroxyisobutyrate dehydrogenase-like beta-hydroxyacid dehydrogenase